VASPWRQFQPCDHRTAVIAWLFSFMDGSVAELSWFPTPGGSNVSHIVTIETEIRDASAIRAACNRLGLPEPVFGESRLFSGSKTGWAVQLPDWRYPVVCDVNTGKIDFDNYGGHWGDPQQLDRFMQGYAVEKAKIEARKKGHSVTEQQLEDGSIKVVVQIGGTA